MADWNPPLSETSELGDCDFRRLRVCIDVRFDLASFSSIIKLLFVVGTLHFEHLFLSLNFSNLFLQVSNVLLLLLALELDCLVYFIEQYASIS